MTQPTLRIVPEVPSTKRSINRQRLVNQSLAFNGTQALGKAGGRPPVLDPGWVELKPGESGTFDLLLPHPLRKGKNELDIEFITNDIRSPVVNAKLKLTYTELASGGDSDPSHVMTQ